MALGNFFVNMGYMSFGQLSSPTFFNSNYSYCNFQMPIFCNQFNFNYNQPYNFFQGSFTQPFTYTNTTYNFSYNTMPFKADYSSFNQSYSFNSTPISISDFYSSSPSFTTNTSSTTRTRRSSSSSTTTEIKTNTPTSTRSSGIFRDYDSTKGQKLADTAMHNAGFVIDGNTKKITSTTKDPDDFTSYCTRYVKVAIRDAGLGEYYDAGSAYQMTSYLRNNDNFKEISSSTPLKDIPAGCILVYDRGVGGYSSEHGHIEIKTDDGRAVSDGITDNLYKRPSYIFMPV